jgi:glycosyltransferase involved in cell wall biosynthesis
MHVTIDARYVAATQSGVGIYTANLVEALAALDSDNLYTYIIREGQPTLHVGENFRPWTTRISFENHWVGDLWQNCYLPFRLRARQVDLFHGPAVFLPLAKLGFHTVVTIHDLVAFRFPETIPVKYGLYMRLMINLAVRSADRVIAASLQTRRDLVERLRVPAEKIAVIHEGLDSSFEPVRDPARLAEVRRRYGLRAPYILFVGNLEPRKNLVRLIEAFGRLKERHTLPHQLVVAGKRGWLYRPIFETVERLGLREDVVFTGYAASDDLPALYAMADLFAFPSLYEGFGLPVLEAMACGTPVLTARTGSLPEVAGDAAWYVDPLDVEALADGMARILTDSGTRTDLVERGALQAKRFSWARTAAATLEIYRRTLEREGGSA